MKGAEHAKDIAAFANRLGGVILVGADCEKDKTKLEYVGLERQTTAEVTEIYEKAALLCSPPQNVNVVSLQSPDGKPLVAINIDPSLDQIVGSPVAAKGGNLIKGAWRFPVRRGSVTDFVDPHNLAQYMNRRPAARTSSSIRSHDRTSLRRSRFTPSHSWGRPERST
jgi:predicted HTH transcriptional regulator